MKKILFAFLLLLSGIVCAQNFKFAWITDIHVGAGDAENELDSVVSIINYMSDVEFTIVSGDITEKGRNNELEKAKEILDKLKKPYYILPGNHDTKWSESGTVKFYDIWKDDKFVFEFGNMVFIGINSGIIWRGGGGHYSPESIEWLKNTLNKITKEKQIIFITHHQLDSEIDNWYKVYNILIEKNVQAVLCGHGHVAKQYDFNGLFGVMGRASISDKKENFGFNLVENKIDSLLFYTVSNDSIPKLFATKEKVSNLSLTTVDSSDFINYSVEIINKINLNATFSAAPVTFKNNIYLNSYNGILTCYDSILTKKWNFNLYGKSVSTPAVEDNIIAAATLSGDLYTLDAEKGLSILSIGFNQPITSQLKIIEYNGGYDNLMLPKESSSKSAVVLGTSTGNMFCYDLETLQELWVNKDAKEMIETTPLYFNNKLIYGSWDSNVYCLDSRKGWLIWKQTANKNFYYSTAVASPVTDGKNVFVSSPDKNIYAIDLNLGKIKKSIKCDAWESLGISSDNKKLLIKGIDGIFTTISTEKLTKIKDYDFAYGLDTMPSVPLEDNDNIIFGSKNGNVYLIDKLGKMHTLFFMGTSRVHSIKKIDENKYVALNMDGIVVVFSIKNY